MKICYLILAHNNPGHFTRLVKALSAPNTTIFIHLDAKTELSDFQPEEIPDNAVFIKKRVRGSWGGWSLVQATLNLLNEALLSGKDFDYYCLLSGSDYPVRSQAYIENYFQENRGKEFISVVKIPNKAAQKPMGRFTGYHIDVEYNRNTIISRMIARMALRIAKKMKIKRRYKHILKDGNPYGGSQWWALTHSAVQYIMKFTADNKQFVRFFINAYIPDESFFQVIIQNSPYKEKVARDIMFADWSRDKPPYPAIIDLDHLQKFKKDGNEFINDVYGNGQFLFARKFPNNSQKLLEIIHKEIW